MNEKLKELLICIAMNALVALSLCALVLVLFLPCSAFSATTPKIAAETQWGDIRPTNSIGTVFSDAGFASTGYVHEVASQALAALTNDFAANFMPLAAPVITNIVDDVLAPRTMEFHYHSDGGTAVTNAFVAPRFATSKLTFVRDDGPAASDESSMAGSDAAYLYSEGKLRNYSMLVESIPKDKGYLTLTFHDLADTHRIYAQPRLYTSQYEKVGDPPEYASYSWDLVTNDLPCVITVREPEAGTLVVSRIRLDQEETYIRMENDEPVIYTDGE